jgi:hypothetical protein
VRPVLIKESHISATSGITAVLARVAALAPTVHFIEIEVETLAQLSQALGAGTRMVLLDDIDLPTLREAVQLNVGRAILEVSGWRHPDPGARHCRHRCEPDLGRVPDQGRAGDRFLPAFSGPLMTSVLKAVLAVDYERPHPEVATDCVCSTRHAWAWVQVEPGLKDKIRRLFKDKNAVMVSHYCMTPDL